MRFLRDEMNREIKSVLTRRESALRGSDKSFKAIFEIMFSARDKVLCEGNDGFRVYKHTYGETYDRVVSAAGALYEKIGATGGFVALELENGPDWITAFWAILMSGNKPYLVNMRYPEGLTAGILKTLDVKYIVCEQTSAFDCEAIPVAALRGGKRPPEEVFADELAFSSSATSMNEVVCFYSGEQVSEQILNFKSIVRANPRIAKHYKSELKQLAFLPFYHVFGLFAVYFWYTFFGTTLVFLRDYSADTIVKTCRRHNVTHIFAVPMLWHTIEKQVLSVAAEGGEKQLKRLQRGIKFTTKLQNIAPNLGAFAAKGITRQVTDKLFGRSVMFCISGGSYLRDSALCLLNGIGYSLHNGYGMSEVGITSVELRKKPSALCENSIGRPFDSVEYRLTDGGELLVRGSSICKRKLVNGDEKVIDGWFSTGDIVEKRGEDYFILGRMGDVVIGENGENINPDCVEKLFSPKGAKALCVLGLESGENEELSLVVQINRFASSKGIAAIRDEVYAVNSTLPAASAIKKFYFTFEELAPPTAVKVSRKGLLKKIASGEVSLIPFGEIESATAQTGEITPLMEEIRGVIVKTLGVKRDSIGPATHVFYDLGATSIQYFSLLNALAEHFEITQYSKNDKYCYTLKEMTDYIEGHL